MYSLFILFIKICIISGETLKIAYFTDTYEPQINGVVISIKLSIQNLRKNGHEVYIFCPSGSKKDEYTFPVFSKKFKNYPEYKIGFPSFDLIKKIKKIKPDIIHIHTPATIGMAGLAIAKLFDIPIVTTYHTLLKDYMSYITSEKLGDQFIDMYTLWFFDRSSTIIAPSTPIKKILVKNGIKKPIKVLPTPIDVNMISKKSKNKNKKFTILHVGRLCKEKRIEVVLDAFKDVLKQIDAKLIITSAGPDEKRLKNLADNLNISKNVKFTGYLPVESLKKLYSASNIFVSASDTETQGLVVLEAMANGCPVIARNALGFKDVIKDGKNGLLFDRKDELSEKIILLFKDKKLRSRLIKGGLRTASELNSENYIKKIEKIYKENFKSTYNTISSKIFYSCFLFLNLFLYWFLKNIRLSINSRLINLYLRFIRILLSLKIFNKLMY
jgi:1,2-diacylglycerol 3-alpha-glucosyltransferase